MYDWLVKNGRMDSRKYYVGESYGGFRGPRITQYMQTQLGVAMSGVTLISPYLDPSAWSDDTVSPLPWMTTLPRSEEHTSELPSLIRISYAVLCLKKNSADLKTKIKAITVNIKRNSKHRNRQQ